MTDDAVKTAAEAIHKARCRMDMVPCAGPDMSDVKLAEGVIERARPYIEHEGVYAREFWRVQAVLDHALGTGDDDGAGEGTAGDVALVVKQRDEANVSVGELEAEVQILRDALDAAIPQGDRSWLVLELERLGWKREYARAALGGEERT